jgi:hypothetical protein
VPVTSRNPGHRSAAAALTVVLDLAAPIIVFYGLRWAGAGVFVALIAGAIAPTLSMLVKLTKDRRVDGLAVAVLGVLLLSAGVSLIDGSPQFLAAKDCVLTAAWGGWFFLSLRGARATSCYVCINRTTVLASALGPGQFRAELPAGLVAAGADGDGGDAGRGGILQRASGRLSTAISPVGADPTVNRSYRDSCHGRRLASPVPPRSANTWPAGTWNEMS